MATIISPQFWPSPKRPRVEAGKNTLPGHKTPLKNFYLTGDYTFPGIGTWQPLGLITVFFFQWRNCKDC